MDVQTQAPLHKNDYPIKSILHPQSILTFEKKNEPKRTGFFLPIIIFSRAMLS